jgi:hypothetical protein
MEAAMTQPRKRKPGRPPLPKSHAKASILPVRFDVEDLALITAAARAKQQTTSEWIRNTLRMAAEESLCGITLHRAMEIVLSKRPALTARTDEIAAEVKSADLYRRKDGQSADRGQISARARKYPELFAIVSPGTIRLIRREEPR